MIAYDSRNKSAEFARLSAEIMSYKGIRAHLFSELTPTPVLSFAVRYLKASAGIVITASHNPKEYNGYRALLFNEDGTPTARTGKIIAATPMKKFGEISDLIGTLMWLADDNASGFVTGTVIPVDGGFSAYSGV